MTTRREIRQIRLQQLLSDRFNGKQALMADKTEIAATLISRYANGSKGIGERMRDKIEDACGLPRGWMDLPMEGDNVELPVTAPVIPPGAAIRTYEAVEELNPDSYVLVDRYDVQLSAGCGNIQWVMNEKDPISFRARWFQQKRLNPEHCKALYVRGRSMEPKLEDWDTVLIDTSQTAVVDGEIYAVCLDDEFFIKTVQRIAGGVLLKSENPDFSNIEVTGERMETLCIIGKKVWRGG